jgi:uncharacterized protein YlxW (UPF0749 family)
LLNRPDVRASASIAALAAVLLSVSILFAWCTSSDVADVPPAVIEHEKNAVLLDEKAASDEKLADESRKQQAENQVRRDELKRQIDAAHRETQISKTKLNELENEYEKLRKTAVPISNDALDDRERRLLAKLRAQQDGQ